MEIAEESHVIGKSAGVFDVTVEPGEYLETNPQIVEPVFYLVAECIKTTEIDMPKLKLTYFAFDGGRGEPIRLALAYAKIPFEDYRFPSSDWPTVKSQTPLHQVPVMEVDGKVITQSNTLLRYAGNLAGMYPGDPLEAAHCDEAMDVTEEIVSKVSPTMFIQDEAEKRRAREALAAGPIPLYLGRLATMLKERGGRYFAGDRLSVADLKVFLWTRHLQSGQLDHIPADIVQRLAPALAEHYQRIGAVPEIVDYYKKRASA
jgi:glutathione S-transferase